MVEKIKENDKMSEKNKKSKKELELEQQILELTQDLQRTRADFENYRKRVEAEKQAAKEAGQTSAILRLLPVIDNIERSISYIPDEIKDNNWVQGVAGLIKGLDKSLDNLDLKRIDAKPGQQFDPSLHEAVSMDEEAEGEVEIISEELQPGYLLAGRPIRHAMVKVTRQ